MSPEGLLIALAWVFGGCDLVSLVTENWDQQVLVFSTIEILLCVFVGLGVGKNWQSLLLKAIAVSLLLLDCGRVMLLWLLWS